MSEGIANATVFEVEITPEMVEAVSAEMRLARCLYEAMERLDPGDGRSWNELGALDREFYVACIEAVLNERAVLSELNSPVTT